MKTPRLLTLLLVLSAFLIGMAPRTARAEVSFNFFYDSLDPMGQWLEVGDYGYCWRPDGVDADWTPYSDGYWSYTDAGWTWVSYEDWGGITYHYGRWVNLEDEGWCWVPDYQWAPAWVSWRHSDRYVGWAPLPPEARFRRETGISVWVDNSYDIGPGSYNFCETRDFGAPVIRQVIFPRSRNVTIISNTVNITNITYYNNEVFCGGPRYEVISRVSARPVPTLKLVRNTDLNVFMSERQKGGRHGNRVLSAEQRGNTLQVFAPAIVAPTAGVIPKPPKVTKVIAKDKVNKGWNVVADPAQRQVLKKELAQQSKGITPENAPAKPVEISQLKPVPAKADLSAPVVKAPSAPPAVAPTDANAPTRLGKNGKPDRKPAPIAPAIPNGPVTAPIAPDAGATEPAPKTLPKKSPNGTALTPFNPGTTPKVSPNSVPDGKHGKNKAGGLQSATPLTPPEAAPIPGAAEVPSTQEPERKKVPAKGSHEPKGQKPQVIPGEPITRPSGAPARSTQSLDSQIPQNPQIPQNHIPQNRIPQNRIPQNQNPQNLQNDSKESARAAARAQQQASEARRAQQESARQQAQETQRQQAALRQRQEQAQEKPRVDMQAQAQQRAMQQERAQQQAEQRERAQQQANQRAQQIQQQQQIQRAQQMQQMQQQQRAQQAQQQQQQVRRQEAPPQRQQQQQQQQPQPSSGQQHGKGKLTPEEAAALRR